MKRKKKTYPSRDRTKSTQLPVYLYDALEAVAISLERSVSYLVRKSVEAFLAAYREDSDVPRINRIEPTTKGEHKGTYLPKSMYLELEAIAKSMDRPTAFLVRVAVENYLADHKPPPAGMN